MSMLAFSPLFLLLMFVVFVFLATFFPKTILAIGVVGFAVFFSGVLESSEGSGLTFLPFTVFFAFILLASVSVYVQKFAIKFRDRNN